MKRVKGIPRKDEQMRRCVKYGVHFEQVGIAKDDCIMDQQKFGLQRWATTTIACLAMLNCLDYILIAKGNYPRFVNIIF